MTPVAGGRETQEPEREATGACWSTLSAGLLRFRGWEPGAEDDENGEGNKPGADDPQIRISQPFWYLSSSRAV